MRKTKTQKGITLVALIITIIVLLILAVVAIKAVQGDGIIGHAKAAREQTQKAQVEEEIKLALNEWKIVSATENANLKDFLENKFGVENIEEGENDTYIVTVKGYEVTIDKNGNIVGDIVKAGPKPVVTGIKVVENSNGTGEALAEKSIEDETKKLYITFNHTMEDGGATTVNPAIPFEVSANGTYSFTITGPNGESKTVPVTVNQYNVGIKIGDKVAYNEGYAENKTNTVDSNFKMDDMDWRVLDIDEESGTVKLISSRPTTSKLTLTGQQGWLDAETKLDTLCSDLYANGEGVTARSLKVEDIDKLANYNPTTGSKWRYKYDPTAKKIQYSKSTNYNPTTKEGDWTEYEDTGYDTFKDPRYAEINSSHYQDAEGNPIIAELEYTSYSYSITNNRKTADNISVADLIYKGLNKDTGAVNSSGTDQWLSSRCVYCGFDYAYFSVRYVYSNGRVNYSSLWYSHGASGFPAYAVRPVVSLPSSVLTTKVEGTWQVNL